MFSVAREVKRTMCFAKFMIRINLESDFLPGKFQFKPPFLNRKTRSELVFKTPKNPKLYKPKGNSKKDDSNEANKTLE